MPRRATDFDETLFSLLKDPKEAAAFLNEHLESSGRDRDALFLKALRKVAMAQGIDRLSSKTKLTRRAIEKALSATGNPRFSTLSNLLNALGLHVSVEARPKRAS